MSNSFRELLLQRRMVRSYLPDPVDREVVERIVGVVRRAPSAGFSQGHRLFVVSDDGARKELARLAGEEEYVANGMQPWISVAPVHIVVGVREASYHERYRKPDKLNEAGEEIGWPAPYWYVDSGACFMLLQLAALDEGLGTGVYGVLPQDAADSEGTRRHARRRPLHLRRHDREAAAGARREPARLPSLAGAAAVGRARLLGTLYVVAARATATLAR